MRNSKKTKNKTNKIKQTICSNCIQIFADFFLIEKVIFPGLIRDLIIIVKIWKPKHYEAIPHYIRPESRDPFEYKLRTKELFLEEHKTNLSLECRISYTLYNWAEGVYEDRNRKVCYF